MKELWTKLGKIKEVCSVGRAKGYKRVGAVAVLLLIMVLSIFIGGWAVKPMVVGREIKVNVINIPGEPSSWVYNTNDVVAGVQHAVNDVKDLSKNRVRVTGETYSFNEVTSLDDLERVVMTAGPNDVIINSHGEVWPVPSSWQTQNDAGSGGDAGGLDDPLIISFEPPLGIYSGRLKRWDIEDCYQFQMINFMEAWYASPRLEITMDLDQYTDFDLHLYDSNNQLKVSSTNTGSGVTEKITIMPDSGEIYKIRIAARYIYNYLGYPTVADIGETYTLTLHFSWKGYCPYVLVWDGSHFEPDNSVIHNGPAMEEDNYILQRGITPYPDGTYGIALGEWEEEVSTIDQVGLCAVDHEKAYVARDGDGNVFEFDSSEIVSPLTAYASPLGYDATLLKNVTAVGEGDFTGLNGTRMWLYFSNVTAGDVWLVTRCDLKAYTRTPCINVYYGSPKSRYVGQIHPREKWAWEAVCLTPYIDSFTSDFEVRLDWTDKHKIDVIGLVINPQRSINIHEGTLESAIHCKYDVKNEIQERDNQTVTLNPGEGIWMNFTLPAQTKPKRDFLLGTFGNYQKFDRSTVVPNSQPTLEPRSIASLSYKCPRLWETQYITRLRKTCNNGTVLASVVGWSLYYLGNETMGPDGLKTFTQTPIDCHTYNKYNAFGAINLGEAKFKTIYDHLPDNVFTDRPFVGNEPLLSTAGYVATDGLNSICTASIVVNSTGAKYAGAFIHSGMSAEQSGNHAYSDWLKGYVAAALSIEEARSRLFFDAFWQEIELGFGVKRVLMASAVSYWVPCTWGLLHDPVGWYYYVDTIVPIRAAFQEHWPLAWVQDCLSIADFWADGEGGKVEFKIDPALSGIEIGRNSSREFTDKLKWYHIGMVATGIGTIVGALVGCPCPVGLIIGAIPLIQQYLNPQSLITNGSNVCATGQSIVTEGNVNCGTFLIYVRTKFYGTVGGGEKSYQFSVTQMAWYSEVDHLTGITVPRKSVGTNYTLGFTVNW